MSEVIEKVVGTRVDASVRERVMDFLAHESELIDSHQYDAWLDLWTEDAIYWVPANEDDYDPRLHISIIYDDYALIEERCFRLTSGVAHSQEPHSRLCHVIGNVQMAASETEDAIITVTCKMVLLELRARVKNVYGGRWEFELVDTGSDFKMRKKKVILIDNDEPYENLSFLL